MSPTGVVRSLLAVAAALGHAAIASAGPAGPAAIELDREDAPAGRVELGFDAGAPVAGWAVSLGLGYLAPRPLVLHGVTLVPVSRRETLVLGGAVALGEHVVVDLRVPLARQNGLRLGDARPLDRWVIGDLRLAARIRVAGTPERAVFARAALTMPTGDDDDFVGEPKAAVAVGLIGRLTVHGTVLAATLGVHLRGRESVVGDRLVGNEVIGGLGAVVPLPRDLGITGELVGALGDDVKGMRGPSPLEARIGILAHPFHGFALGIRAGVGLVDQIGAPRGRVMVEVAWQGDGQLIPRSLAIEPDSEDASPD